MATLTLQKFRSIEEVKQAIRNGSKVYVCYERRRNYHAGVLFWNKSMGYMRRFMGIDMNFDFSYGRNNEPEIYYTLD